ncbi:PREDICTED: transcription factor MYB108-like [Ipomoea nil]|uniref:transcription factor MYB108-like n=1 Tax=Ipomoea nil TaxID=35883 RepID=UPI000901D235|nr:PREDICTED: transcription factor MYB108-like [Ipomoea nil]
MEDSDGGFGYNTNFRSGPPRLPLDRFLWAHHSQQQVPNVDDEMKNRSETIMFFPGNRVGEHSSSHAVASWPNPQEVIRFYEFIHGVDRSPPVGNNVNESPPGRQVKYSRSSTSTLLIRGQWSEEEDRNLIRLVNQYGVKKWAQVAEMMAGRAGKQCRERWQNHLRPDIKLINIMELQKDSWSEEEERVLIEVHEKLGNRWAEIAKRIPGRTENSVKNHWNATKRRQNSTRRSKKVQENKSTVLQDYIKAKYPPKLDYSGAGVSESRPSIQTDQILSPSAGEDDDDDDSSSLLMQEAYHDEDMSFMESLFGNDSTDPYPTIMAADPGNLNKHNEEPIPPPPDRYLAYLLEGATTSPASSSMEFTMNQLGSSYCYPSLSSGTKAAKDIDLMELIFPSPSQSSQGSNNNTN